MSFVKEHASTISAGILIAILLPTMGMQGVLVAIGVACAIDLRREHHVS